MLTRNELVEQLQESEDVVRRVGHGWDKARRALEECVRLLEDGGLPVPESARAIIPARATVIRLKPVS